MEFERCYGCMRELDAPGAVCPHCGFDNTIDPGKQPGHMLKCGTVLNGRYTVGRFLGQGGFGITYLGFDPWLDAAVCIKEYYPEGGASRTMPHSGTVHWGSDENALRLRDCCQSFVSEAEKAGKLQGLKHVAGVRAVFCENETAYIIMDFVKGETLGDRLVRTQKVLREEECAALMAPVMQELEKAHEQGIIHRDIKPDNLMYTSEGELVLLNMGAAKDLVTSGQYTNGTTAVRAVSQGFSPQEQYRAKGTIGPWTDVYAMCATIYYCTTGSVLPTPMERIKGEKVDYSGLTASFAAVLEKGLALRPEDRCRSMRALLEELSAAAGITLPEPPRTNAEPPQANTETQQKAAEPPRTKTKPQAVKAEPAAPAPEKKKSAFHPAMILAAILLVAIGFLFGRLSKPAALPDPAQTAAKETAAVMAEATPETTPIVTPKPTPEATPEATPKPTPEATPETTPKPTPEPTPEATPEATPKPTPEATPEATPKPAPEATPEAASTAAAELKPAPEDDAAAMNEHGRAADEAGNHMEALSWYLKAADAGDAQAMYNVGNHYAMGIGVERDYREALRWYTKSADAGFPSAMTAIGSMYEQGYGVEKDGREALTWYQKAADAGDATAMNNIGILYADGKLVEQDIPAATEWLRKAADNGSSAGARNLGLIYYLGYGVEQDYTQALTWFRKAADAGDAAAMHGIGDMYEFGQGIEADAAKADEWHMRALEAGYTA